MPGVCGGDPCVKGTRIPVWLIERARRDGCITTQILEMCPSPSADDVDAAWMYANLHRDEIDGQIRDNQDAE